MNSHIVQLNNRAVLEMKAGNVSKAFHMLSHACTSMNAMQPPPSKVNSCRFDWEECCSSTDVAHESLSSRSDCEKALPDATPAIHQDDHCPFLFSKCLRISASNMKIDNMCSSEFSWALWYNLAICCSLFGKSLGEKGADLLRTAFDLYGKVYHLIQNEPQSEQWSILRIAVRNNQACIYHELAMDGVIFFVLERLASEMGRSRSLRRADREAFLLNLQILGSNNVASAA